MMGSYCMIALLAALAAFQPGFCSSCSGRVQQVVMTSGMNSGSNGLNAVSGGLNVVAGGMASAKSGSSNVLTRNVVVKGKYPVALTNCGPTPDKQIPVTTSHVKAPLEVKPTVRLPYQIPPQRTVSHTCTCYKTVLRPRVHEQVITVPSVQKFIETTHKPVVENIHYEATPTNCNDNTNSGFVFTRVGGLNGNSLSEQVVEGLKAVQAARSVQVPQVQSVRAVEVVPQAQSVRAVEFTPQVQSVRAVEFTPQVQSVRAVEVVPQVQSVRAVEVTPQVQSIRAVEVVPQAQSVRAVEFTPQVQSVRAVEVTPQVQSVRAVEVVPQVQSVRAVEVTPQVQSVRAVEVVPQVQSVRAVEMVPQVQSVRAVEVVPKVQSLQSLFA